MHPRLKLLAIAGSSLAVLTLSLVAGQAAQASPPAAAPPGPSFTIQPEADQPADLIGRGYFRLPLAPGQTREVRLAIKNTGTTPLVLQAYPVDGVQTATGGVDYSNRGTPAAAAGRWLSLQPDRLTVAPGEAQRIVTTVRTPEGSAAGDYVGGIAVEDERVQTQGAGSTVLIDVYYRQVSSVVVTVPGARLGALAIETVVLDTVGQGSRVLVQLRNTGNVLQKGKGTIGIAGGQATTGALPFTFPSTLPGSSSQILIDLPKLRLTPGTYDVQVRLEPDQEGTPTAWQGPVRVNNPTADAATAALPTVLLAPIRSLTEAPVFPPAVPVVATVALLVLGLGTGLTLVVRRRRAGRPGTALATRSPRADTSRADPLTEAVKRVSPSRPGTPLGIAPRELRPGPRLLQIAATDQVPVPARPRRTRPVEKPLTQTAP